MKKRRIVIMTFLLCATLIVGIGFATVSGALNVSGISTFNGSQVTEDAINTAMKFTKATAIKNCTVTLTSDDIADMTATINDDGAADADLSAEAVYTITYDSTQNLQNVKLNAPTITAYLYENGAANTSGTSNFKVTTSWENLVVKSDGKINGDGTVTLCPGESVDVIVTLTFVHPETKVTGTEKVQMSVGMTYNSVNATTESTEAAS